MALVSDSVKEQLRTRFAERLDGEVAMELFVKPGSGRLILPAGVGCPTCQDARELAEAVAEAAGGKMALKVVDVSADPDSGVAEVPTLRLGYVDQTPRISYQGLPAGFEFATVVDTIERLSRGDPGLSDQSLGWLGKITEPVEVMVFTTPT